MAITKDTTTLPGQTIVTDSNGGIAIDYSAVYGRIATALENIYAAIGSDSTTISGKLGENSQALENIHQSAVISSQALTILAEASKSGQITTKDPLAWLGLMSVYKLYAEDPSGNVDETKLAELAAYKAKIDALVASLE